MSAQVARAPIPPSGQELGYAEITANVGSIGATDTDVTGLSITVAGVGRPVLVIAQTGGMFTTLAGQKEFAILDGSSQLARSRTYQATASADNAMVCRARIPAFTGSKTFKVVAKATAGTATVRAGALGDAAQPGPAFIQATAC